MALLIISNDYETKFTCFCQNSNDLPSLLGGGNYQNFYNYIIIFFKFHLSPFDF